MTRINKTLRELRATADVLIEDKPTGYLDVMGSAIERCNRSTRRW